MRIGVTFSANLGVSIWLELSLGGAANDCLSRGPQRADDE